MQLFLHISLGSLYVYVKHAYINASLSLKTELSSTF